MDDSLLPSLGLFTPEALLFLTWDDTNPLLKTMADSITCNKCNGTIEMGNQPPSTSPYSLCASCDREATIHSIKVACEDLDVAIEELEKRVGFLYDDYCEALDEAENATDMIIVFRKQSRWMAVDAQISETELKKAEVRKEWRELWEAKWGKKWSEEAQ